MEGSSSLHPGIARHTTTIEMDTLRRAQPEPTADGLLAHARKIAKIAIRATDAITGDFLIEKAEEQYAIAIAVFDSSSRAGEANRAREELRQFSAESRFVLHHAPALAKGSAFRSTLNALAASEAIGSYYNGTDDVDEIVAIARRRMGSRDRLGAAEDATRAATCLLWRANREKEAIALYNEFTDVLVQHVKGHLSRGHLYLVVKAADIARKRLLLTGRGGEANEIDTLVAKEKGARSMGTSAPSA
jgi:hypothetical protein